MRAPAAGREQVYAFTERRAGLLREPRGPGRRGGHRWAALHRRTRHRARRVLGLVAWAAGLGLTLVIVAINYVVLR